MPKTDLQEGEDVEFKQQWTDRALEDLAAFVNHRGGRLLVGVRKDGEVTGFSAHDAEIQRIANVIVSRLGVTPSIDRRTVGGREVLEIKVDRGKGLLPCNGRYLTRVGSTNRDLTQEQLARLVLERAGQTWDSLRGARGMNRVDSAALTRFAELARTRLPAIDASQPELTLRNLGLINNGRLTNAAVLLFTKNPQELFPHAQVRVGVFRGTNVVDSHDFRGTLWDQLDGAMERFRRLLQVRFDVSVTPRPWRACSGRRPGSTLWRRFGRL